MSSLTGGSSSTTWQLLWLVKIFVDEDRYWISYWNRSLTNENYGVSMIYRERENSFLYEGEGARGGGNGTSGSPGGPGEPPAAAAVAGSVTD